MGDLVCDGTEFSCPFCTSKLKLKVPSSPGTAEGKKLANMGNCFFPPPGGQCTVVPNAPVPCTPAASPVDPGQSPLKIAQMPALGAGCKFQCAKGGLLTVSSPGQTKAQHEVGGGGAAAISGPAAAAILSADGGEEDDKSEKKKTKNWKKKEQREKARREKTAKGGAQHRGGIPKRNTDQNKQFKRAVKEIEKECGRKLSKKDIRRLHDKITKRGLGYDEIVEEGIELFKK